MATPEPCRVIWHRMGINNGAFPLTVAKAPFTDVRCRTSPPSQRQPSSSVVRILKKRIRRAGRTLSPPKSSAAPEGELIVRPQIVDEGVSGDRSSINTELVQEAVERTISRGEGPDSKICSELDENIATQSVDLEETSSQLASSQVVTLQLSENIPGGMCPSSGMDGVSSIDTTKTLIKKQRSKRFTKRKRAKRKGLAANRTPTRKAHKKLASKETSYPGATSREEIQVQKLKATYNPKGNISGDTRVVILPNLTCPKNFKGALSANKLSPWKHKTEENNTMKESPSVSSRQQLLTATLPSDGRIVKIYLSESHSHMITGAPSAPPGTPTADQLKSVHYIDSLMDIKSQRAVKAKLTTIGNKLRMEEQKRKEKAALEEQKQAHKALLQLKDRQRAEIYALNKLMTKQENRNFKKFMEQQGYGMDAVRV